MPTSPPIQVVLDTNVLVAARRSQRGASSQLLRLLQKGDPRCEINISVPLVLEYEAVLKREVHLMGANPSQVDRFIAGLAARANRRFIYFRWRPFLQDADDDFLVELSLTAGGAVIVTHNLANFSRAKTLGIRVMSPREFLSFIESKL